MYTQETVHDVIKSKVITFPNKDAISRMYELNSKSENNDKFLIKEREKNSSVLEMLLLSGILLDLQDDTEIETDYFTIIAGILLSI